MKIVKICLLLFCITSLIACKQVNVQSVFDNDYPLNIAGDRPTNKTKLMSFGSAGGKIAETATPKAIQELNKQFEQYRPQVDIVVPQKNQLFEQTEVSVQLRVRDLPIFQDNKSKLGNHLDLILDNEPAQAIYDLEQPIILRQLTPGTHNLRVFAARPWGESYKNSGAYAQATFSVLTETNDNRPDLNLPLLTYGNPTGLYGAEPLLLDFYLTNAPLHSVAQNKSNTKDWSIKTTVNGESFLLKNWQPVYLTGLNSGENWIQLELVDESGNNIENVFNNTVRVIQYDPGKEDALARLVSNQMSLEEAQSMVERNSKVENSQILPGNTPKNTDVEQSETAVELEQNNDDDRFFKTAESQTEIGPEHDLEQTVLPNKIIDNSADPEMKSSEVLNTDLNDLVDFKKIDKPIKALSDVETTNVIEAIQSPVNQSPAQSLVEQEQIIEISEDKGKSNIPMEIEIFQETIPIDKSKLVKDELNTENQIFEPSELTESPTITPLPKEADFSEISGSKTQPSKLWLKKIFISLRQRLEASARLLPSSE